MTYTTFIPAGLRFWHSPISVAIVRNPTLSLEGDVEATRRIIDAQDGPVVLVGHSYGGAVITEAGTHPNVASFAADLPAQLAAFMAGRRSPLLSRTSGGDSPGLRRCPLRSGP